MQAQNNQNDEVEDIGFEQPDEVNDLPIIYTDNNMEKYFHPLENLLQKFRDKYIREVSLIQNHARKYIFRDTHLLWLKNHKNNIEKIITLQKYWSEYSQYKKDIGTDGFRFLIKLCSGFPIKSLDEVEVGTVLAASNSENQPKELRHGEIMIVTKVNKNNKCIVYNSYGLGTYTNDLNHNTMPSKHYAQLLQNEKISLQHKKEKMMLKTEIKLYDIGCYKDMIFSFDYGKHKHLLEKGRIFKINCSKKQVIECFKEAVEKHFTYPVKYNQFLCDCNHVVWYTMKSLIKHKYLTIKNDLNKDEINFLKLHKIKSSNCKIKLSNDKIELDNEATKPNNSNIELSKEEIDFLKSHKIELDNDETKLNNINIELSNEIDNFNDNNFDTKEGLEVNNSIKELGVKNSIEELN